MPVSTDDIVLLLWKHLNKDLSSQERTSLDAWAASSEAHQRLIKEIDDNEKLHREFKEFNKLSEWFGKSMNEKFEKTLPRKVVELQPVKKWVWMRWVAAASVMVIISTALYFSFNKKENTSTPTKAVVANDVPPGTYKAKLTLDNGTSIILDNARTGEIAREGSAVISNNKGQLVYSSQDIVAMPKSQYNTLSTGRGEMYPTVLSDGSRIWLNNETILKYEVPFTGAERVVELQSGEAYFVVAHDSKPFKVLVKGTEVEVLGTQFDISAFPNEKSKTSLLTGKIKITAQNANPRILVPGQAATINESGNLDVVKDAGVEGSIAWVNGLLHCDESDLASLCRKLERWYDIQVVYQGKIPDARISGDFEKDIPLSKLLPHLERMTNAKFKIEGRKLIVN
jgi:transmembrane sensor